MRLFLVNTMQSIVLLSVRVILAYGFYEPSVRKWSDIHSVAEWFETLNIPLPLLNAYLSASIESVGVVLLILGLLTRWISLPLSAVMVVAILSVHLSNGFSATDGGFEIPLYYLIFLGVLCAFGAGKISVDYFLFEKKKPTSSMP